MMLNPSEFVVLLVTTSFIASIALSVAIYRLLVFRERSVVYPLYAARDQLIRCVASGAIENEDKLFQSFYQNANHLIETAHTDFFSLRKFASRLNEVYSKPEFKKFQAEFKQVVANRDPQFQIALNAYGFAVTHVLIQKNFLLKLMVRFEILKRTARSVFQLLIRLARQLDDLGLAVTKALTGPLNYYTDLLGKYNGFESLQQGNLRNSSRRFA